MERLIWAPHLPFQPRIRQLLRKRRVPRPSCAVTCSPWPFELDCHLHDRKNIQVVGLQGLRGLEVGGKNTGSGLHRFYVCSILWSSSGDTEPCHNGGKTFHLVKNCWAPKRKKGNGKGKVAWYRNGSRSLAPRKSLRHTHTHCPRYFFRSRCNRALPADRIRSPRRVGLHQHASVVPDSHALPERFCQGRHRLCSTPCISHLVDRVVSNNSCGTLGFWPIT